MRKLTRTAPLLLALLALAAAPAGTESKWNATKGKSVAGTVILLSGPHGARAEWKKDAKTAPVIFLRANDGKIWVRQTGGDIEVASYKGGIEKTIVPALLRDGGREAKISAGGYTLTRISSSPSNADASNFAVRPKSGAASRFARLSGDLLGPSSTSVSATAGGRGVGTKGLKLKDGGDYDALAKLESRDEAWRTKLDAALEEFQKDGKVGRNGRSE